MNRSHIPLATISALVLTLAGCSGGKAGSKTIDNTESQAAGKTLAASVEDSAAALGPANQGPAFALSATCYTLSGDVTDTDMDNIPVDATLTFADCVKTGPNGTATFNGVEHVVDTMPSQATFAFTLDVDGTLDLAANGGATATIHRTGSIAGSIPTPGTYELTHDRSTTEDAQSNGQTLTASEQYMLTTAYTPLSAWTPGTPPVAGSYSATGFWNATVNDASADSTISTSTPLMFDPSCDSHIIGGTIDATFSGPNATRTLTVTWTGCGARTVQYTETPNQA